MNKRITAIPEPIPKAPERDLYPLSAAQRGAWLREQLDPGHLFYNVFRTLEIIGPLDAGRLHQAFQDWVLRYDIMRATFVLANGEPMQRFGPLVIDLPCEDLSDLSGETLDKRLRERVRRILRQPFDLERGPLCRFHLFRTAGEKHLLILSFHHIVVDGVSLGPIIRELMALYHGETSPAPRIQYQDFVIWQSSALESGELEASAEYWLGQLGGKLPIPKLPTDRPRPTDMNYAGATVIRHLTSEVRDQLKALRKKYSTTLFRTLLAALKVLLYRMTGESDIIVGSPLAGRSHLDLRDQIGFFVSTPGLRTRLHGDSTFIEALAQVEETVAGAVRHQEYPFDKLVEQLDVDRDLSRSGVYSVVFTQRPVPRRHRFGELLLRHWEYFVDIASYELTVAETELDDGIRLAFNYRTELFDKATIERLAACYDQLIHSLLANPEARLCDLEILPPAERRRILVDFNRADPAPDLSLFTQEAFEQRAAEAPEAVAAVCGDESIRYGGLNRQANQLASWLARHGAGREARVGIFGQRDLGMLVTILGSLKAGAAYVPLDPRHPDGRIAAILSASGVRWIGCDASHAARMVAITRTLERGPSDETPEVFCWEKAPAGSNLEDRAAFSRESSENLPCHSGPKDLVNVFYTSGSTGVPKGVMVEHLGMLNHLWAKIALLEIAANSVVAQNASHCFDISVWQFLAALLVGGRVVIYDDDTALEPKELLAGLERDGVTVFETVPTFLDALTDHVAERRAAGEEIRLRSLHYLISNAETLSVPLARRAMELFPEVALLNTYGATECSDDTTHQIFRRAPDAETPRMVVGKPIPGFAIYVLDSYLNVLPAGCQGQIAMAGIGVGRGYLDAPAVTAATFVPHPLKGQPGERLYLTGDLGRFNDQGKLDFIGRGDNQVKVRGHRIELGEIEAALSRHQAVHQSAVLAFSSDGGSNRLVAYVVAGEEIAAATLRAFLESSLPPYMVPEQFVQLAAMPLNRNGKIDRKALPEPAEPERRGDFVAPRGELETRIAEIFGAVLGLERVSANDDFFELGGHSLKAIQLTSRLERELGTAIGVRQLFLAPSVDALAAEVRMAAPTPAAAKAPFLPPIEHRPEQSHYGLSVGQKVQWFGTQILDTDAEKFPEVVRLAGALDSAALEKALGALVERHAALRTSFTEIDGEPRQTLHDEVEVPFFQNDLTALDEADKQQELDRLCQKESRVFDLSGPPLLRVRLVRWDERTHMLLLNAPHIVSDGWSEQVLFRDLAALYNAFQAGKAPALAPLDLRYVDFAAWQSEQLEAPTLHAQRDFWVEQFRDASPWTLPADSASDPSVISASLALSPELSARLGATASKNGATLFMVLMTAFKVLLSRFTGRTDVVLGSVLGGRTRPELEDLVGVFINTLALRSDLAGNPSFTEALERVKQTTVKAMAHQDFPFQSWLEILRRGRHGSAYMPFSIVMIVHEKPVLAPFEGLEASYLRQTELSGKTGLHRGLSRISDSGQALRFDVIRGDDDMTLMLSSGSGKFRHRTLERLLSQFAALCSDVTEHPDRLIEAIPLASVRERRQLLDWGRGAVNAPPPVLARLMEGWVRQGSETTVAIVDGHSEVLVSCDPELCDPYALRHYLRRHEATALAAAPELLDALAQVGEADLRGLLVASPGAAPRAGKRLAGVEIEVFLMLRDGSAAGLWGDIGTGGVLFAGRPAAAFPVQVLDAAGEAAAPGILGRLHLETGIGEDVESVRFIPTEFHGRFTENGLIEVVKGSSSQDQGSAVVMELYTAPRTSLERRLTRVWQKVLAIPKVGIEDDFFALGGGLRQALEMAQVLWDADVLVAPGQIMARRTIAALAPFIERAMELAPPAPACPAPLTPLQEALLAEALEEPRRVVRSMTWTVSGDLDAEALKQALLSLRQRHDALRSIFVKEGRSWMQGLREDGELPMEVIELAARPPARDTAFEQAVETLRDRVRPIEGPMLAALLARSASGVGTKLALAASALVVDTRSWSLIANELTTLSGPSERTEIMAGAPHRSFRAWLMAAERLRSWREPGTGASSEAPLRLGSSWPRAKRSTIRLKRPEHSSPDALESWLRAALTRALPSAVETERNRTTDTPAVDLSTTVGQFGALRPATAEDPLPADCRVRLRLDVVPAAAHRIFVRDEDPDPSLVFAAAYEEPDVHIVVTVAEDLLVTVTVRPDTKNAPSAGELTRVLADELSSHPASPEKITGDLNGIVLEEGELEELFG